MHFNSRQQMEIMVLWKNTIILTYNAYEKTILLREHNIFEHQNTYRARI
jgi:hypothetical protein